MADPEVPETDPAAAAEEALADAGADPADPSAPPEGADGTTAGADPAATDPTAAAEDTAGPPYKLTFDHQCFLMDYIKDASGQPLLEGQNQLCPYKNFHETYGPGDGPCK